MTTKLILVEGLPGSGKSTIAELTSKVLCEAGIEAMLFCEGNVNHPADFEGVAFFSQQELDDLLNCFENSRGFFNGNVIETGDGYLIPYRKLKDMYGSEFSDELISRIARNDIYELPLDLHMELVLNRWKEFARNAQEGKDIFIFECCFIQNPITVSMIRSNSSPELTKEYVLKLADTIISLNPVLIYVNQDNIDASFKRVIPERPNEWLNGFIDYYTKQGFGKANSLIGLEGTIDVLKARHELEMKILNSLQMEKYLLNNSQYNYEDSKKHIYNILNAHL